MSKPNRRSKSRKSISLFPSNVLGGPIRNALSGSSMDGVVGSIDEKKYWKVVRKDIERWGSDENGEPIIKSEGYDMSIFFFDSPDQYERLFDIVIDESVKGDWYARNGISLSSIE